MAAVEIEVSTINAVVVVYLLYIENLTPSSD